MRPVNGNGHGNGSVAGELRRLADALSRLVREHLDLARAELKADATRVGKDAGIALVALPFAAVGFLLVNLAVAAFLAPALSVAGALAAVGAWNLFVAAGVGLLAVRRFRASRRQALEATKEELKEDRQALQALRRPQAVEVVVEPAPPGVIVRTPPPGGASPH